jgi:hypothetical protein
MKRKYFKPKGEMLRKCLYVRFRPQESKIVDEFFKAFYPYQKAAWLRKVILGGMIEEKNKRKLSL